MPLTVVAYKKLLQSQIITVPSPQTFVLTFAAHQLLQNCTTWPVYLFQHGPHHPRRSSRRNLQLIAHTLHILY